MSFLASLAALAVIAAVEYLAGLHWPVWLYLDFFLLYTVYSALMSGALHAQYAGLAAGLTEDLLGYSPVHALGVNGFCKTVVAFAVWTANRYVVLDSLWLRLLTVVSASLLNSVIVACLLYILGQSIPAHFAQTALTRALCTSAAAVLLFRVADRIRRGTGKQLARPYAH